MKKKSSFILQGSVLALAGVLCRIIGIARRFPMQHIIGDIGNGYYSVAYEVYNIMLIISCYSLPLAISKVMSQKIANKEYKNANRVFKCSMVFAIISGGICFFIATVFGDELAVLAGESMSAMAIKVLGPALLLVAIMGVFRGYFQGLGTMIPTAVSQIIEQILVVIATIIGAYYMYQYGEKVGAILHNENYAPAYGAAGASLGPVFGAVAGLIFLVIVFIAYHKTNKKQLAEDNSHEVESYGIIFKLIILTILPVLLSTTIYNISGIIDIKLYNTIMDAKGLSDVKASYLGVYSGKYRVLVNVPIALANAMCSSIVPVLVSLSRSENRKVEQRKKITQAMQFTMIIAIPSTIGLAVLARPIISLLFSGEIDLAVSMLHYGSISIIFYSMSTLTNGALQGINKMKIPVIHASIALGIHIVFLIACLEMNLGITAMVYANILFALIVCVLNSLSIRKYIGYRQELKKTFIIPLISSVIMGIIIFLISMIFNNVFSFLGTKVCSLLIILVSLIVAVIVYFAGLILFKAVGEEELKKLPGGRTILKVAKKARLL